MLEFIWIAALGECWGHFTIKMETLLACIKSNNKNSSTLSLGCRLDSWFQTKQQLFLPLHGKSQVTSMKKLQLLGWNFLLPEVNNRLQEQISWLLSDSASSSSCSWQGKLRGVLGLLWYLSPHSSGVQTASRQATGRSCPSGEVVFSLWRVMQVATRRHSTLKCPT